MPIMRIMVGVMCDGIGCREIIEIPPDSVIQEFIEDAGWEFEYWAKRSNNELNHFYCPKCKLKRERESLS